MTWVGTPPTPFSYRRPPLQIRIPSSQACIMALVRLRNVLLHDGHYLCMAYSVLPLPLPASTATTTTVRGQKEPLLSIADPSFPLANPFTAAVHAFGERDGLHVPPQQLPPHTYGPPISPALSHTGSSSSGTDPGLDPLPPNGPSLAGPDELWLSEDLFLDGLEAADPHAPHHHHQQQQPPMWSPTGPWQGWHADQPGMPDDLKQPGCCAGELHAQVGTGHHPSQSSTLHHQHQTQPRLLAPQVPPALPHLAAAEGQRWAAPAAATTYA